MQILLVFFLVFFPPSAAGGRSSRRLCTDRWALYLDQSIFIELLFA